MNFYTGSEEKSSFTKRPVIVRQSSDRDPETGLITYAIHVADEIKIGDQKIMGELQHFETPLDQNTCSVICLRMGWPPAKLQAIGAEYLALLGAIADAVENPATHKELVMLGIAPPEIPIPDIQLQ